ncbi:MAG TPA: PP2C family protein-serine/threonine phosphatase [Gemmatales bacterium]|nr:PP2C family protein-serine/threonine phosphatase [Gemmatales bacterium]
MLSDPQAKQLPEISNLDIAAYYQTAARAGGDYYDIFPLPDNLWGILIADVSGHGTPAAVLMAVTHSIVHSYPGPATAPGTLLGYVNQRLHDAYTTEVDAFVTAFYGSYDPINQILTYANAGHPQPRVKRCSTGKLFELESEPALPLGIFRDVSFTNHKIQLIPGDQLILYTDGITEAHNTTGNMYGIARLDAKLSNCGISAQGLIDELMEDLNAFSSDKHTEDDRTLLVIKVR